LSNAPKQHESPVIRNGEKKAFQVRKLDKDKGEQGIHILVPKFPKSLKHGDRRRPENQAEEEHPEEEDV